MPEPTEAILKKSPLFASLTDEEMRGLAARATRRRFHKDEQLFAEGDPCSGLFLVARKGPYLQTFSFGPGADSGRRGAGKFVRGTSCVRWGKLSGSGRCARRHGSAVRFPEGLSEFLPGASGRSFESHCRCGFAFAAARWNH